MFLRTGIKLVPFLLFSGFVAYGQSDSLSIDAILSKDTAPENFGVVVYENMNSKVKTTVRGNACSDRKVNDSTIFNIASCTKTYVAAVILMLHDEGKLNINDPVNRYLQLEELPVTDAVTIRSLLNHTSGLPDVDPSDRYVNAMLDSLVVHDRKEVFRHARIKQKDDTLSGFSYSNIGYCMLGLLAENVTQLPMQSLLDKYIFQKIGARNTYAFFPGHKKNVACPGYELLEEGSSKKLNYLNMDNLSYGAGNIYTTARELDLFIRALFIDKILLKEKTLREMLSAIKMSEKSENGVGMGVYIVKVNRSTMLTHTGRYLMGYTSSYSCFPDLNYSVVILRNNIIVDNSVKSNTQNKILSLLIKRHVLKKGQ